jgi:streptogramin lyase
VSIRARAATLLRTKSAPRDQDVRSSSPFDTTVGAPPPIVGLGKGDLFAGCVLEATLGQGGMGIVYRAYDVTLRRQLALKVIAAQYASDPTYRDRFLREARLAAQIEHPNLLRVYRAGECDGRLYLAMRLIEGTDLREWLQRVGRLPLDELGPLIAAVGAALDAAHARGLVHRDVKPANVLVAEGPRRRVFLSDFGLAMDTREARTLTQSGQRVGTVAYMAPEQIRGEMVDARTDVYALGGVLHQCLTGRPPYPRTHELDALAAHLNDPAPRPSLALPGIPRAFDRIVARALAKDPDQRFGSAGELAEAVQAAVRPRSLPLRVRTPKRLTLRSLLAIVLFSALVFAGAVGFSRINRASQPETRRSHVARTVHLDISPAFLALVGGRVWSLDADNGEIRRVDPGAGRPAVIPVPQIAGVTNYVALVSGLGSLWVVKHGDDSAQALGGLGTVDRLNPVTGRLRRQLTVRRPRLASAGTRLLWIAAEAEPRRPVLLGLDPRTDRFVGSAVPIGSDPAAMSVAANAVWIADRRDDQVLRLDQRSRRVTARIRVGERPSRLASFDRFLWVLNSGDDSLSRIDTERDLPVGTEIQLGKHIEDIAVGGRWLWVAAEDGTLTRLDAATGQRTGLPVMVAGPPLTLVADAHGVWVASGSASTLQRVEHV